MTQPVLNYHFFPSNPLPIQEKDATTKKTIEVCNSPHFSFYSDNPSPEIEFTASIHIQENAPRPSEFFLRLLHQLPEGPILNVLSFLPFSSMPSPIVNCSTKKFFDENCLIANAFQDQLESRNSEQNPMTLSEYLTCLKLNIITLAMSIRHLDLSSDRQLDNNGLKKIVENFPHLETLSLKKAIITDRGLILLANFRKLRSLCLSDCKRITNDGLRHLENLHLQFLNLASCRKINDNGLAKLSKMPLHTLIINCLDNVTNQGIEHLSSIKTLQNFQLVLCTLINDAGLEQISHLTSLKTLNISCLNEITDVGLSHLRKLPLERLLLNYLPKITDCGLQFVGEIHSLHHPLTELKGCHKTTRDGRARLGYTEDLYPGLKSR